MRKQAAGVVDRRLAKALSHPLRAHVLAILNERVASPNQLSHELEEPLGNVSYHVKTLARDGLRRARQHRAAPRRDRALLPRRRRAFFSDTDWSAACLGSQGISDATLQLVWEDTSDALDAGTFDLRTDRHLSRNRLVLDQTAGSR